MRRAKKGGKPAKSSKGSIPEDDRFFAEDDSDEKEINTEEEEDDEETPEAKRLRMTKEYLESLKPTSDSEDEGDEDDEDAIATRLQNDVLKARGKTIENFAVKLQGRDWEKCPVKVYRGHKATPTCLAVTMDDKTAFTGSKDCSIIRWDVETGTKQSVSIGARGREKAVEGHSHQVLGLSVSSDGNLLASGGRDKMVCLWDVRSNTLVQKLKGHRDDVTCLSFQRGSHTLYSGSNDRQVRVWDCDSRAARETLFGHQAEIHAIDSLLREVCVTVAADQSMRLWKIPDDSQLLFPSPNQGVLDSVSMFNDEIVLTGGQDGLTLWSTLKRVPSAVVEGAHGECGVVTVKTLAYSNIACSGSWDGFLRLWQLQGAEEKAPKLSALGAVPISGFLNGLHLSRDARFAVAAVGQEHRLGRWNVVKAARNGLHVISLSDSLKEMTVVREIAAEKKQEAEINGDAEAEEEEEEDEGDDDTNPFAKPTRSQNTTAPLSGILSATKTKQPEPPMLEEDAKGEGEEEDSSSFPSSSSVPSATPSRPQTPSTTKKPQTPSTTTKKPQTPSSAQSNGQAQKAQPTPKPKTPLASAQKKAQQAPAPMELSEDEEEERNAPQIRRLTEHGDEEEEEEEGVTALPPTSKRKSVGPKMTPAFSPKVLRSGAKTPLRSQPPAATQSAQKTGRPSAGLRAAAPATEVKRPRTKK